MKREPKAIPNTNGSHNWRLSGLPRLASNVLSKDGKFEASLGSLAEKRSATRSTLRYMNHKGNQKRLLFGAIKRIVHSRLDVRIFD